MSWAAENWQGLALVVTTALGSGGIAKVLNDRRPKGGRENAVIDQLQENAKDDRERIEKLETDLQAERVARQAEAAKARVRETLMMEHLWALHRHIAEGKPPPPPPFPADLLGGQP